MPWVPCTILSYASDSTGQEEHHWEPTTTGNSIVPHDFMVSNPQLGTQ